MLYLNQTLQGHYESICDLGIKIQNPIRLSDHVLIILPKLTIFVFWKKKKEKKYEFTVQKPEEIECSSLRQSKDMIKS